MIIDSPIITDMALGVDRRVMEPGDAQLRMPSDVQAVISLMKPTRSVKDLAAIQTESAFVHLTQSRTNQAALTTTIMILAKGLWRLQLQLLSKFNWGAVAATIAGVKLEMVYNGDTNTMLMHIATSQAFNSKAEFDFLLIENATIQLTTDITAVGQTSDARASVNAVRIL